MVKILCSTMALSLLCSLAYAQSWRDKTSGIFAEIETSEGLIVCELFEKEAPNTVANFVDLSNAKKEWTDQRTGKKIKSKFYDGLKFHRVIPSFMIQGGDPLGNGMGGPGYKFDSEISKDLKFDKPGRLAMANSGPNTNGSQFFITEKETSWLNGGYSIFGQVVQGQDIVSKIANAKRDGNDRPYEDITINKVTITRLGQVKKVEKTGKKVLLIVAPVDYNEKEYDTTKKVLEGAGLNVITGSTKLGELKGKDNGTAESSITLKDADATDYSGIIFIGGDGALTFSNDKNAQRIVEDSVSQSKILCAIDVAPVTLAKAGALKGKRATVSATQQTQITSEGASYSGRTVEEDGYVITGNGPDASEEFAQTILRILQR